MKFADIIKKAREKAGVSQTDIAKLIGIEQPTLSHLENINKKPSISPSTLRKLCQCLDLNYPEMYALVKPELSDIIVSEENTDYISKTEKALIKAFRALPPESQERLIKQAEYEKWLLNQHGKPDEQNIP